MVSLARRIALVLIAAGFPWILPAQAQPMEISSWVVERSLVVDGPVRIEGSLNLAGNADVKGPVDTATFMNLAPGALPYIGGRRPRVVHGPLTVHGSLTVHGDLLIRGPLTVDGPIRIFGTVNAEGPMRERRRD